MHPGIRALIEDFKVRQSKFARLDRRFFQRDAETVAKALLGQQLVHHAPATAPVAGIIVETEAYLGTRDKASHAYGGRRTARTETMYADGGTAYVFLNYGLHNLFNIVVSHVGDPQAVLIRHIIPTDGLSTMYERRPAARADDELCSGPGKLGAAFGLDRSHNGIDLVVSTQLYVTQLRQRMAARNRMEVSARIGIDYAEEWKDAPLRFRLV